MVQNVNFILLVKNILCFHQKSVNSYVSGFITPSLLALASFGTFGTLFFNLFNYVFWLRITDEGFNTRNAHMVHINPI